MNLSYARSAHIHFFHGTIFYCWEILKMSPVAHDGPQNQLKIQLFQKHIKLYSCIQIFLHAYRGIDGLTTNAQSLISFFTIISSFVHHHLCIIFHNYFIMSAPLDCNRRHCACCDPSTLCVLWSVVSLLNINENVEAENPQSCLKSFRLGNATQCRVVFGGIRR
jgi:hypothetical protein